LKKGKEYELLIEKIYNDLEPNAKVKQDDYILGEDTGIVRQIDISIRSKVADTEMLIIVQAKDYKHKADVNVVGTFIAVIRDVRAQKGILICNQGFTKAAIKYAQKERIELYSAHSALSKKWELEIKIPVIQSILQLNFSVNFKFVATESRSMKLIAPVIFSPDEGITTFSAMQYLFTKYSDFKFDTSGKTFTQEFKYPDVKVALNPGWMSLQILNISYTVTKITRFINYYTPTEYRVLKNHINSKVTATHVNYDGLIDLLHSDNWVKITSNTQIPVNPNTSYIDLNLFDLEGQLYINYIVRK
jgi:hypothetical protein